jgi:hypothetical protein
MIVISWPVELGLRAGMPLFLTERLENASLWMRIMERDISAEYNPLLRLFL